MTEINLLYKLTDRLINLDEAAPLDSTKENEKIGIFLRDFGMKHFDWPQGVGLFALYKIYEFSGNKKYLEYLDNWFKERINEGLPTKNINTTIPLLTLSLINQKLNNPKYDALIKSYYNFLMNELPRTSLGGFEHITTNPNTKDDILRHPNELWADTIFMSVLFLMNYGVLYNDKLAIKEAIAQIDLHIKYLYNSSTGLFYHGYSFNQKNNFANAFWCRGNCWFTLALPLMIQINPSIKDKYKDILKNHISHVMNYIDNGMFHTLIDDSTSYVESSGTSGIIAGVLMSINLNIIKNNYSSKIKECINALVSRIDDDGNLQDVSCGTGISCNINDYKNIIKKPMAYGQSLIILALLENIKEKSKA